MLSTPILGLLLFLLRKLETIVRIKRKLGTIVRIKKITLKFTDDVLKVLRCFSQVYQYFGVRPAREVSLYMMWFV